MKKLTNVFLILLMGLMIGSCTEQQGKGTIKIAYVNWAEGVAMAHVAKVILEDEGYRVKMMNTDAAPLFASLAKGSADFFLETWMPVTHKDYMDKYGDQIDILGTDYDNARIGLVVPEYVDIHSIDELNEHKAEFDGKIVGIDAGAGIMRTTEEAISEYDLDFKLQTSSESGMTATLKKAIDKEKWVVVTGWTPHWIFSRYEVKMLEDPKGVYGEGERIEAVSRKGFKEDEPWVAELVSNMKYDDDQIGDLMDLMDKAKDEDAAATQWVQNNPDIITQWMPEKTEEDR